MSATASRVGLGLCVALLLALGARTSPIRAQAPGDATRQETRMLELTNQARADRGLPAYRRNDVLQRIARRHAAEVGMHEHYSHVGLDGRSARRRALDAGYGAGRSGVRTGENYVARATVEEAFAWLMDDPPHARNILHPTYREIGIGVAPTTWGGWVWVMDLGYHDGLASLPEPAQPETATPMARGMPAPPAGVTASAPTTVPTEREPPTPAPALGPPLPGPSPLPGSRGDSGASSPLRDAPAGESSDWGRSMAQAIVMLLLAIFLIQALRLSD